jgi:hypothetical protein
MKCDAHGYMTQRQQTVQLPLSAEVVVTSTVLLQVSHDTTGNRIHPHSHHGEHDVLAWCMASKMENRVLFSIAHCIGCNWQCTHEPTHLIEEVKPSSTMVDRLSGRNTSPTP